MHGSTTIQIHARHKDPAVVRVDSLADRDDLPAVQVLCCNQQLEVTWQVLSGARKLKRRRPTYLCTTYLGHRLLVTDKMAAVRRRHVTPEVGAWLPVVPVGRAGAGTPIMMTWLVSVELGSDDHRWQLGLPAGWHPVTAGPDRSIAYNEQTQQ